MKKMSGVESLKRMAKWIAIGGGFATVVMWNSVPAILSRKIRDSDHYQEAIKLLHSHPEAVKYLGDPIKEGNVATMLEQNYGQDDEKMWCRVPVHGPKSRGALYYDFLLKQEKNKPLQLRSAELTLENLKDYKLILKRPE
ncbi:hypothetical protein TKK_0015070 [Trichogramma kaykai]